MQEFKLQGETATNLKGEQDVRSQGTPSQHQETLR